MPEERMQSTDHDLLIQLNTRFELFERSHQIAWADLLKQMTVMITKIEQKADRSELQNVDHKIDGIDKRLRHLEETKKTEETQKETVLRIGLGGIKLWQVLTGIIITILSIFSLVGGVMNIIQ